MFSKSNLIIITKDSFIYLLSQGLPGLFRALCQNGDEDQIHISHYKSQYHSAGDSLCSFQASGATVTTTPCPISCFQPTLRWAGEVFWLLSSSFRIRFFPIQDAVPRSPSPLTESSHSATQRCSLGPIPTHSFIVFLVTLFLQNESYVSLYRAHVNTFITLSIKTELSTLPAFQATVSSWPCH